MTQGVILADVIVKCIKRGLQLVVTLIGIICRSDQVGGTDPLFALAAQPDLCFNAGAGGGSAANDEKLVTAIARRVVVHVVDREKRGKPGFECLCAKCAIKSGGNSTTRRGGKSVLLAALQYIPAGIALGWTYEKSNTIWAPILLHMTINAISFGVMSFL